MNDSADMIGGQQYQIEELRRIAFGRASDERLSRDLALGLLGRKDYPEKVEDFERVLGDDGEAPNLRMAAAVELGRIGSDAALNALIRHRDAKHDLVARGVLNGLRRIDNPRALEAATRQRDPRQSPPSPALARSEEWTSTLLAFRHGTKGFDLPNEHPNVRVDPKLGQEIRATTPAPDRITQSLQDLAVNPLGIELSREQALELRCGDREMVLLFNRELVKQDRKRLFERKTIAGLVAVRYTLETDNYSTKYAVLLQPLKGTELRILVTTTKGNVILSGTGKLSGDQVKFEIKAVDRPGLVPIEIEGTYTAAGLGFEHAVSELHRQRRPEL